MKVHATLAMVSGSDLSKSLEIEMEEAGLHFQENLTCLYIIKEKILEKEELIFL